MDGVDHFKMHLEDTTNFSLVDSPYLGTAGSECETYSKKPKKTQKFVLLNEGQELVKNLPPFDSEKIKELFSEIAKAKGKVLITHSDEHVVNRIAACLGMNYLFSYSNKANGNNENAYVTNVFSINICEKGLLRHDEKNKPLLPAFIDNKMKRKFKKYTKEVEQIKLEKSQNSTNLPEDDHSSVTNENEEVK